LLKLIKELFVSFIVAITIIFRVWL